MLGFHQRHNHSIYEVGLKSWRHVHHRMKDMEMVILAKSTVRLCSRSDLFVKEMASNDFLQGTYSMKRHSHLFMCEK